MELIAITPPYFYPGEDKAIVNALTTGGFSRVHIRKPGCEPEDMRRLLESIPAELRHRLSLHDHTDLAREYGVGGVHLNRRNPEVPPQWVGMVSRSIHSVAEIASIADEDYVFLSPIYPSISKPGYKGSFDLNALRKHLNNKIYALGGVTADRLSELAEAGFGGAAMLSAAWRHNIDPTAFKLQFITHGTTSDDIMAGALAAADGGCRWIQVRMKDASITDVERVTAELAHLRELKGVTLIVDDHVELAMRCDWIDGVHVGKNDMPVSKARQLLGPGKILGATANTYADVHSAAMDGANYIGLGPLRFTTTKKNLSPVLGINGYTEICSLCHNSSIEIPIVAIGGIAADDIPAIMHTGVSGIAVSGTILRAPNPADETRKLINIIEQTYTHKTNTTR